MEPTNEPINTQNNNSQMPVNPAQVNTTFPNNQQVNNTPLNSGPRVSEPQPKQQSTKMLILAAVAGIITIAATAVGTSMYFANQAKSELSSYVDKQLKSFNAIEKNYNDTEELLKLIDKRQDSETSAETTNNELLKVNKTPAFGQSAVLGIEEDLNIDIDRKMAQKFKDVNKELDIISKNNERIKDLSTETPIHSMFLPKTDELLANTDTFIKETMPLMRYMDESTNLGIELTTLGYDIALSLNETILRGADEASLKNFQSKLKELEQMKTKYEDIDTTGLEQSIQKSHTQEVASFDEEIAVFYELEDALVKKDVRLLEKAINSLLIQGQAGSVNAQVERLSFWQNNDTVQSLAKIKQEWKDFSTDEL